ncbi:NfeD family protein [Subtercola sp. PAMC28395]|uniref:NfeD family protein n=1 Tax=Subtercola sp. PAMC28395 TaxID=2846775 RepID=UPI001C0AA811|nr:NfeD family protein [Subtercola sp. PAMC28395]QWT23234.1 NfeD family protein [Subtercola sp. PAMC28395]
MTEFLASYAWLIWLALILVFLVIETLSLDLIFLMLAIGSLGGVIAHFAGVPFLVQIPIVGAIALLLIFTLRPPLLIRLRRGSDPTKSNVEALLGLEGRVVSPVTTTTGSVKLSNGETWTARVFPSALEQKLLPGEPIFVKAIEGATALVEPEPAPPAAGSLPSERHTS